MGCCQSTHWERTSTIHDLCKEESVIKAKEVQFFYSAFQPLVGATTLATMKNILAGDQCRRLRQHFSSYFDSTELLQKLVLAFLLLAELPHCQKVHLLLQLQNDSSLGVGDLENLVDSLTELASRVLPFAAIAVGKGFELHHYIASLTKARAAFRKQCLQALGNRGISTAELRHKLLTSPLLKALVSSSALRRQLWALHNRVVQTPPKIPQVPQSARNSRLHGLLRESFEDSFHSKGLADSQISTITSERD